MNELLVRTRALVRDFGVNGTRTRAVDGVDLDVGAGEFVAIMGPSGCGKTTLLHLIGGLDRPTSGEVWVDGRRMDQRSAAQWARFRRTAIGFVFQSYNLVPNLSVLDNVRLPALLAGAGRADATARARELLDRLGLADRSTLLPSVLSGGEQQRAAVARALVNDPPLILADEPTGALDSRSTGTVLRLLREVNGDGVAVVLVTHEPRVATSAKRLLMMRDGAFVEETRLDGIGPAAFADLLDAGDGR